VRVALAAQGHPAIRGGSCAPYEDPAFPEASAHLNEVAQETRPHLQWLAAMVAFKAVVLEGLEVVFIVIAVGAGRGLLLPASVGALAAALLVLLIGALLHRAMARVPENTLKFAAGAILSAFGVFWTGERLGVEWPGQDLAILVFAAAFVVAGL